jgi:hypothetical protein
METISKLDAIRIVFRMDGEATALLQTTEGRFEAAALARRDLPALVARCIVGPVRQSWRARLAAAGATFWEEDHGNQRSLYVVDPSGNVLEITTPETPPFAAGPEQPDATPDGVVDRWIERVTSSR